MENPKNARIAFVMLAIDGGVSEMDACQEAVLFCASNKVDVQWNFNQQGHRLGYCDLLSMVDGIPQVKHDRRVDEG